MATPLGPYSPVVQAGEWVIVSGQLGVVAGVLQDGVASQTAAVIRNLEARLGEAGGVLADVVKTTCFLTDMSLFEEFNAAYAKSFGPIRPARSTVGVAALPLGAVVEIEAWARRGGGE